MIFFADSSPTDKHGHCPTTDAYKQCKKCREHKPLGEFYFQKLRGRHFSRCKHCISLSRQSFYEANSEKIKTRNVAYIEQNFGAHSTRIRADQLQRTKGRPLVTPKWADVTKIHALYEQAHALTKSTGIRHSVDHIVPLGHPLVCGLHCEANMEVMTMVQNASKGGRYWPDMPDTFIKSAKEMEKVAARIEQLSVPRIKVA